VFFRLIVNAQISFDERTAILIPKTRVGFSLLSVFLALLMIRANILLRNC
jgi:hypothetical protein